MKRYVLSFLLFFIVSSLSYSIEQYEQAFLKKLGFTEDEITRLVEIQEEAQEVIQKAQAEIEIYRAQLKKLLLSKSADLREAERFLRQAVEWEIKIRMAQIRKEIKARNLLGDRKWAGLVRALKTRAELLRSRALFGKPLPAKPGAPGQRSPAKERRMRELLQELEELLESPGVQ